MSMTNNNNKKVIPIAREGIPFIIGGVVFIILYLILPRWVAISLGAIYTLFAFWFFRDPPRYPPQDERLVISPADGRVVEVERIEKVPYTGEPAVKVGIFMSPFDVHVNRAPSDGVVERIEYHQGGYLLASKTSASELNERNAIIFSTGFGLLVVVQIAGLVARRIVCYLKRGDKVSRGERFGLIRFGSRLDVYIPPDCEVFVRKGDKLKAGESPLGRFRDDKNKA